MKQPLFLKYPVFILSIMLMLLISAACEKKTADGNSTANATIRIGEYYPLTGELATFGISAKNGIDLAKDEANRAGGLLGKQIEVIVEDDRGMQQEATTVVQKLIDKDRVIAV